MEQINQKDFYELNKELDIYLDYKNKFVKKINILKNSKDYEGMKNFLKDKSEEEWVKFYDEQINKIQDSIKNIKENSLGLQNSFLINNKTKNEYLQDINANIFTIRKIIKEKKEIKKEIPYVIYKPSEYGSLANYFFENITFYISYKYPKYFDDLIHLLILGDVKIISRTYVSMILLSSCLSSIISFISYLTYVILSNSNLFLGLIKGIPIAFLSFLVTAFLFYFYPYSLTSSRKKAIKNDLPFVIIHMAAIAGSGASPVAIFNLILNSGEYKGLEGEIKKIVNYVNLFGYDLSTALKAVSFTTPSTEFKDLLTGIIAATESGGDLKSYLKGKASDALNTYRLDRKKYVESLAIYSDVYTGLLIASPLLFMTTLAIINVIGGEVGGVSVKIIATIGTFFVLPLLNIIFLLFLTLTQPET